MSNFMLGIFMGSVLGLLAALLIYNANEGELLMHCQSKLPRDQYCTLVAVPKSAIENVELDEN